MNGKPYLEFREDGTFQVLHITDLQEEMCIRDRWEFDDQSRKMCN